MLDFLSNSTYNIRMAVKPKLPAAVEMGRLGGLKGGPARAKKLSPAHRRLIARYAALVRWHKGKSAAP